ncbi:MAG: hypothetical protein EBY22_16415 [Gammaproteobacteria bacterium]|nr:hypothetical protein [Gammaproteobacteria bacterium]
MSAAILTFASLRQSEVPIPPSTPMITVDFSAEGITAEMGLKSQNLKGEQAVVGNTMPGLDSSSLQGGQAAVSSPMPGWDSSNLLGGQAAVSSPMAGWNSPMAGQWPLDWATSPTSPGCKVPPYAEWPNCTF